MLPSVLAKQLQQGLADYIETTFPMPEKQMRRSLQRKQRCPARLLRQAVQQRRFSAYHRQRTHGTSRA